MQLTREDWIEKVAPFHFPSNYARPIQGLSAVWKNTVDPLGSLLEMLKWARLAPTYDCNPAVFVAQVVLESNFGLKTDALLGIKATKADIEAGTYKRLATREVFTAEQVEKVRAAGDLISIESEVKGSIPKLYRIRCYQKFHFEPGLADDFERYFRYYVNRKPKRARYMRDTESFIRYACEEPYAYATDDKYVSMILSVVKRYALEDLNSSI